jgi:hypothetical protein
MGTRHTQFKMLLFWRARACILAAESSRARDILLRIKGDVVCFVATDVGSCNAGCVYLASESQLGAQQPTIATIRQRKKMESSLIRLLLVDVSMMNENLAENRARTGNLMWRDE